MAWGLTIEHSSKTLTLNPQPILITRPLAVACEFRGHEAVVWGVPLLFWVLGGGWWGFCSMIYFWIAGDGAVSGLTFFVIKRVWRAYGLWGRILGTAAALAAGTVAAILVGMLASAFTSGSDRAAAASSADRRLPVRGGRRRSVPGTPLTSLSQHTATLVPKL